MSLNVNPDIEARLVALAQASGLSVEDFLKHVVEEKSELANVAASASLSPVERAAAWRESVKGLPQTPELEPEEWVRRFKSWAHSHDHDNLPVLSDYAVSRDSMYD
jgi:hypothetical protein